MTNPFYLINSSYQMKPEKTNCNMERLSDTLDSEPNITDGGGGDYNFSEDRETPPEDFRVMNVVPCMDDIRDGVAPILCPARMKGAYDDTFQYLDIQFRLMREDFLIPFREGISKLRKFGTNRQWKTTELNLRLYHNVQIVSWNLKDHLAHLILLDEKQTEKINWAVSKRLIQGSLVCLSRDSFQTMVFATIDFCETYNKEHGFIPFVVKSGYDVIYSGHPDDEYVMAESTTLFEPYLHVMQGLQASYTNLPLREYILKCRTVLKPPRYLLNHYKSRTVSKYNLSCLMKSCEDWKCPVLTTTKWPPCESMCLNKSQREAAILALTKEMVLIQGPPGTGKTYVGLKVMEAIMKNLDVVFGTGPATPILIVCYTNHALDQFLEGILKFCDDGIVRVGGGSKCEKLKKFNLKELKKQAWGKKCDQYSFNYQEYYSEKNSLKQTLQSLSKNLDSLKYRIVYEGVMRKFMDENHYRSLCNDCKFTDDTKSRMVQWLKAPDGLPDVNVRKILEDLLTKLVLRWDTELPSLRVSSHSEIQQRASLYRTVVSRYEEKLQAQIECSNGQQKVALKEKLDLLRFRFVEDKVFKTYLPKSEFKRIKKYYSKKERSDKDTMVKVWVLGLNNNTDDLLHDLTTLTQASNIQHSTADNNGVANLELSNPMLDEEDESYFRNNYSLEIYAIQELEEEYRAILNEIERDKKISERRLNIKEFIENLSTPPLTEDQAREIRDVSRLDIRKRFALYNMWCQGYRRELLNELQQTTKNFENLKMNKDRESKRQTVCLLKEAKVIGMTTTGAAKHRDVLHAVGSKIVVVEEAAEVFESHIITALNPQCNHLILIGDHQQLRPKPNVYELARHYGLEVSLFERLIKNNVPHVVLKVQHRMRPEISKLMRHIYPELEDDDSVLEYEHIRGVEKDVYFINHTVRETQVNDSCSKQNLHEAKYIVALCIYLLNQGYSPKSITILTAYTGQVLAIKNNAASQYLDKEVRVAAVDDFQGEENDIILLSLVRSNEKKNVGFLKIDNRICVALSRAKKGFYVIGNFNILCAQSSLWSRIVEDAKSQNMLGEGLPVCCHNHPENRVDIKSAEEFKKRPEGGCGMRCDKPPECGHTCELLCHGYDLQHKRCNKPCKRTCSEGHPCKKICSMECRCEVLVVRSLPCGHETRMACSQKPEEIFCLSQCSTVLECSHQCSGKCGRCLKSKEHKQCKVLVSHTFSCGDVAEMPCYKTKSDPACQRVCGTILDCKHSCTGTCSTCTTDKHVVCSVQVSHTWPCGHVCVVPCHVSRSDPPCQQVCNVSLPCSHRCRNICSDCAKNGHNLCMETCKKVLKCDHICKSRCSSCLNGSHQLCEEICGQELTCGHKCQDKCGICSQSSHPTCLQECQDKLPCGHKCRGKCGVCSQNSHPTCLQECQDKLPCGHKCSGKCSECKRRERHQECQETCTKTLLCGHACTGQCGQPCPTCQNPCPNSCKHRSCRNKKYAHKCGEPCQPCENTAVVKCQHTKMRKTCSEVWTKKPCQQQCTKTLNFYITKNVKPYTCRHECSGICNEPCVCAICESVCSIDQKILSTQEVAEREDLTTTRRLLIKLQFCSHIFYVDELDKYMKSFDPNGTEYIGCPECSYPIMNCLRYDNILKERHVRRETRKQLSGAASHLVEVKRETRRKPKQKLMKPHRRLNDLDEQQSFHHNRHSPHPSIVRTQRYDSRKMFKSTSMILHPTTRFENVTSRGNTFDRQPRYQSGKQHAYMNDGHSSGYSGTFTANRSSVNSTEDCSRRSMERDFSRRHRGLSETSSPRAKQHHRNSESLAERQTLSEQRDDTSSARFYFEDLTQEPNKREALRRKNHSYWNRKY
ncbi:NFX1-type zinc finger-containing protein 1-like [Physella acuta]|uniref:NFX1-type zinc finger-containing protein 1-like n=1 Tax=Physella acuta TaxID=109671 RepID=UPI0027DB4238|nr:NFX1-type zinc finger-containing protein 1-like [Physella acuta]